MSKERQVVTAPRRRNASNGAKATQLTSSVRKNAIDLSREVHWSWDISTGDVFLSDKWVELVGISTPPKNSTREFLKSIINADDLAGYESRLQAHLSGRTEVLDCECRLLTKAGAYRWARVRGRIVRRDKRGNPVQMVGTIIDRKDYLLANRELEQSHTQLSAIFEAAEEMIWVVDPKDFRLLTFNSRLDELIFKTRGIHPRRGMGPEDLTIEEAHGWKQLYKKALKKGSFETEYELNSLPRRLHVISKCLMHEGKVFGICIIGRDITARRQMEEALRKSEEKFSKAFLDSPIPLLLTSMRDHRYMEVNEGFLEATGYERDEVIGKTPVELAIWANPEQRTQLVEVLHQCGSCRGVELAFRTKSGEIRQALGSASKIDIDGEPCMLSVAVDVTERNFAVEALRESEERLRIAIESGPMYTFEWDPQTDVIRRSAKSAEILDFAPGPAPGTRREFLELMHVDDRQNYLNLLAGVSPQNPRYKVSYRLIRPGKEVLWLEESGRAFFGPDHTLRKLVGVKLDVTETRQSERTLRELSGRLITSQEEERRRIARELHDHIGQELALLCAHAQRVDSGVADEEHTAHADVHELYRKIKELAVDVSNLSHRLHSSELDFLGLASAADRLCRDFASQSSINMDHQIKDIPPNLDRGKSLCFYRILQECLQNVSKHSRATRVLVELYGKGKEITLRVVDNGIGFEVAARRFGSGLGLVSMRERLNLVGGSLEITSGEGRGTIVIAKVPVLTAPDRTN